MANLIGVQDAIYVKLSTDSTVSGLTGAVSGDTRVYAGWQRKKIALDATYPAYIVIEPMGLSEPVFDREGPMWQVSIFAKKASTCMNVLDRVTTLLDKATLTATSHHVLRVKRAGTQPMFEEDTNTHHWAITYELHTINQ